MPGPKADPNAPYETPAPSPAGGLLGQLSSNRQDAVRAQHQLEAMRRQLQGMGQRAIQDGGTWTVVDTVDSSAVQEMIQKALVAWRQGEHSFAVESLEVISRALDGLTKENESLREDRNHLRSENQRLREVNLRLQEQILKRLEDDHKT